MSVALVSKSCPVRVVLASGALRCLFPPLGVAMKAVLVAAAAVQDCPIDHSILLHGPLALAVPAGVLMRIQTVREQPAVLLDLEAAIAGTAFPFLCSMRVAHAKCANRLLCRRLPRRTEVGAEGCYTVT